MIILAILILLVPALVSVLLFERLKGYVLDLPKRIMLTFIFAFLINMTGFAFFIIRRWDYVSFSLDGASSMTDVSFVFQYMVFSLVSAVVLAYILSLVRVVKRSQPEDKAESEEQTEPEEQTELEEQTVPEEQSKPEDRK